MSVNEFANEDWQTDNTTWRSNEWVKLDFPYQGAASDFRPYNPVPIKTLASSTTIATRTKFFIQQVRLVKVLWMTSWTPDLKSSFANHARTGLLPNRVHTCQLSVTGETVS